MQPEVTIHEHLPLSVDRNAKGVTSHDSQVHKISWRAKKGSLRPKRPPRLQKQLKRLLKGIKYRFCRNFTAIFRSDDRARDIWLQVRFGCGPPDLCLFLATVFSPFSSIFLIVLHRTVTNLMAMYRPTLQISHGLTSKTYAFSIIGQWSVLSFIELFPIFFFVLI